MRRSTPLELPTRPRSAVTALVALTLTLAAASSADGPPAAPGLPPIAEATHDVEQGQYVAVEGRIVERRPNVGRWTLWLLEDPSGSVVVAVPNRLHTEHGKPAKGRHVRVFGQWDHAALDPSFQGIRVQKMELVAGPASSAP